MALRRLDHYNIDTAVPEATIEFYCDVLGCVNAPERRPAVSSPGTWLLVGDHPVVHVQFVEESAAASTGPIDHVAFQAEGYLETRDRLEGLGVDYECLEFPQFDLFQIYVTDPNGVRVELNIPGETEAVAGVRKAP